MSQYTAITVYLKDGVFLYAKEHILNGDEVAGLEYNNPTRRDVTDQLEKVMGL